MEEGARPVTFSFKCGIAAFKCGIAEEQQNTQQNLCVRAVFMTF